MGANMTVNLELYRFFCEVAKAGNVTKAANYLEISRRTLYRKIEKYGINLTSVKTLEGA